MALKFTRTIHTHTLWCDRVTAIELQLHNTHTHTHSKALFPGLPGWADTRKVKPIWISLKQETVSGSGISWAVCKSAPRSRQKTMPEPHHSVFYRPDALPAAHPTASKHWRHFISRSLIILRSNGRDHSGSKCSLITSKCIVQLSTSKGCVRVCYVTQGSVHVHCRHWVKASWPCSRMHTDMFTDASMCICGHILVFHVHGHIRKCTQGIRRCVDKRTLTHLSLLGNWQAD